MPLRNYTDDEILARLSETALNGWWFEDGWIRRKITTSGWPVTLMVVNAIGFLCEAADHHADLAVSWGKLTIKLRTHCSGGITDRDFELAQKLDELLLWLPTGGALEGHSGKFVSSGAKPGSTSSLSPGTV